MLFNEEINDFLGEVDLVRMIENLVKQIMYNLDSFVYYSLFFKYDYFFIGL